MLGNIANVTFAACQARVRGESVVTPVWHIHTRHDIHRSLNFVRLRVVRRNSHAYLLQDTFYRFPVNHNPHRCKLQRLVTLAASYIRIMPHNCKYFIYKINNNINSWIIPILMQYVTESWSFNCIYFIKTSNRRLTGWLVHHIQ